MAVDNPSLPAQPDLPSRLLNAWSPAILVAALITGGYTLGFEALKPLPFNAGAFQNIGIVLAPLVAVAAFIERAVEVLLTPSRSERSARLQAALDAITADPAKKEQADLLRDRIITYKAQSQRYAFYVAIGLGVAASVLGVRSLANLLADGTKGSTAFDVFDIALTGLVVGGGADGIHRVVGAVTSYMDMVTKKSQAAGAAAVPKPPPSV